MGEPTSDNPGETQERSLDALFTSLANTERRLILGLVYDRAPEPVPRSDLATAYAAWESDQSPDDVTDEERQEATAALHHLHLPRLAAAGVVECDSDDGTVALADHPAFEDSGVLEVIQDDVRTSPASLDALFGAISDGRRRAILDVLSHQLDTIHVETLARELEADGRDVTESEVSQADVAGTLQQLRHADLPSLSEAELVDYDPDEGTVSYTGHPQLRVPWMHSVLQDEFRQTLTGESQPDGIGEIEGRESVVSFGQSLCERADEELFCMFTDTQLLEAGCFTRIRDASRRGTDVYLGTRDQEVRDYVQKNAPEVTRWEPNTDWLNLPVAGDRVGRLLLADREAVMLGTLLEETSDGVHEEQSIVGEGKHNTLVTMICQLLSPRLEKIDEDTEDVEVRLPL